MHKQQKNKSTLFMFLMRIVIYSCIIACFFWLMSINNFAVLTLSRTSGVTLLTYLVMIFAMNSVYGGYAVGKKKSKPVISSMSLSVIITDIITYLQLQIMNANPDHNETLILFGPDFPLLLLCIVIQVVLIIFWVRLGNNMYFRINPPQSCCVVLGPHIDKKHILYRINRYRLQYQVSDIVSWDSRKLEAKLSRNEIVFLCGVPERDRNALLIRCYELKKDVLCMAELEDIMLNNAKQTVIDDTPFLEMSHRTLSPSQRILKRVMDLVISICGLIVLSPVMLVATIAIYSEDGKPVIFHQKRVTKRGRLFDIYKFRTMDPEASKEHSTNVSALQDDTRITKVGRVLRKFRIDELPQLINIVKGDMSLVGPRPEMVENVIRYKKELPSFKHRERMQAGLTGYAQIEGKYNTSASDKLMLDLMYIESYSLWLDIKLLFRTLLVFFKSDSTEAFKADALIAKLEQREQDIDNQQAISG